MIPTSGTYYPKLLLLLALSSNGRLPNHPDELDRPFFFDTLRLGEQQPVLSLRVLDSLSRIARDLHPSLSYSLSV